MNNQEKKKPRKKHKKLNAIKVALVINIKQTKKKTRIKQKGQTEPGLVALYDIRPGNGCPEPICSRLFNSGWQ